VTDTQTAELDPEVQDSPVYWFAVLTAARKKGDYALAAEADRQLRRLGVRVTYPGARGDRHAS
jgi:hypothetical protein